MATLKKKNLILLFEKLFEPLKVWVYFKKRTGVELKLPKIDLAEQPFIEEYKYAESPSAFITGSKEWPQPLGGVVKRRNSASAVCSSSHFNLAGLSE